MLWGVNNNIVFPAGVYDENMKIPRLKKYHDTTIKTKSLAYAK